MIVRLQNGSVTGEISAISSKSDAHRLLLAAALADRETELVCNILSDDIRATARCLQALGAGVTFSAGRIAVRPIESLRPGAAQPVTLDCGESGSTLRFLLPVVSALQKNGVFTGGGRLPERPITQLREAMEAHGVRFSAPGTFPIHTTGALLPGAYTLPGNVSSQYITGLLFALPLLSGDSVLRVLPPVESAPYIEMTLATLRRFGVCVEKQGDAYHIPGNQCYRSPGRVAVEGDWSNAAFFLVAGALGAPVTITGLHTRSPQGDKAILDLLRRMGAAVETSQNAVRVSPGRLSGIVQDMADIPDLAPVFAVAAACAETGVTRLENAGRLRLKESDRLAAIAEMLQSFGVSCTQTTDTLTIPGGQTVLGGQTSGFHDHRMVMAAAVASVCAKGPVTIEGAEAVEKSYPHFFEDWKHLGGNVDVLDFSR